MTRVFDGGGSAMTKPRNWKIVEALTEVLRDFDCTMDEAKAAITDAVGKYENEAARDAWEAMQERGLSDDTGYRRDMILAGRGHLLGD